MTIPPTSTPQTSGEESAPNTAHPASKQRRVVCQICGDRLDGAAIRCREMMYGLREEFNYRACPSCGCLQIESIPEDIGKHYPQDYYSFGEDGGSSGGTANSRFVIAARRMFTNWLLAPGRFRRFVRGLRRGPILPRWLNDVVRPVGTSTRILDVGCGSGRGLLHLYQCGFTDLTGADPFIAKPVTYHGCVRILKCGVEEIRETFDLIMLHHVFEHMDDPAGGIRKLAALLRPGGQIMIRIPLWDSQSARDYGANWVQLDAPRHFFLHTRKSMNILAEKAGLTVANVVYDSHELQFWGSEQYARDIPLNALNSHAKTGSGYTRGQMREFKRRSGQLNRMQQGDQANFILVRKD